MKGQIRLTEQGEVINAKYANPEIGRRNLETLMSAALEATLLTVDRAPAPEFLDVAAALSVSSMAAYRKLVYETPGFTDYFFAATPDRRDRRAQHRLAPGLAQGQAAASTTCEPSPGASPGARAG